MSIKNKINEKGNELGFSKIGFARVKTLLEEQKNLAKWLSHGYNGSLTYMIRNQDVRCNPSLLFYDAKSVVVFAYKYSSNVSFNGKCRVAKYSIYRDYHLIIRERLELLAKDLELEYGIKSAVFVDSSAIMEKQWAVLSGIGWQGKNSLIINKELGSFFNIGIMLLDCELSEYSVAAVDNLCGGCDICLRSCPTDALIKDKVVDCNKCLSYWNIESKGEKPSYIKKAILDTGYIFGCDICQDVCPYNKLRFMKDSCVEFNLLAEIKQERGNFNKNSFNKIFIDSPIKRAKYNNFINCFDIVNSEI